MNISGPAAVAKPEMLFYAPGDLTVTDIHPSYVGHIERGMQNPTLSTLERISQGLGISMEDLFKDIDTPINVENAAIRHLSQVISELSPEQTQQLLQIVDSVMAIKNEYL